MTGYESESAAAIAVLDRHLVALNAGDATALADTLHFPHYRLAGTRMQVWRWINVFTPAARVFPKA